MTSTSIDGAEPATTSPIPNVTAATTNGTTGPRRSDTSPAMAIPSRLVVRKTEKARPYCCRPPSSRAATGIAVATAIASNATATTTPTTPTTSEAELRPSRRGGAAGSAGTAVRGLRAVCLPGVAHPLGLARGELVHAAVLRSSP